MKAYNSVEIDFESGNCGETFESRLNFAINRVNGITNPYVGNKRKILFEILDYLRQEKVEYNSVLDLFSGSSSVSLVMKLMNKQVFSNDLLTSSYNYAKAFVEWNGQLSKEQIDYLLKNKFSDDSRYSLVEENFQDRFTLSECKFLDNYRANIEHICGDNQKAYALACMQLYVIDHCFVGGRLNNGQILAGVKHRIEHSRNDGYEMNFANIRWYNFSDEDKKNKAYNEDAINLLNSRLVKADLVYIDPPYGGQQSDYENMYRFFESYVKQQPPDELIINGSDKFAKKKGYEQNFREMLVSAEYLPTLLISYNDDSWVGIDPLKTIVQEYREDVKIKELEYDYKYRDKNNKKGVEYLILAR